MPTVTTASQPRSQRNCMVLVRQLDPKVLNLLRHLDPHPLNLARHDAVHMVLRRDALLDLIAQMLRERSRKVGVDPILRQVSREPRRVQADRLWIK